MILRALQRFLIFGTPLAQQGSQGFWLPSQMIMGKRPVAGAWSQSE
jgi:hypothetical protein